MTFSRRLHPSCWNCWLRWVGCIFLGVLVLWSVPATALGGQESARRCQHTVWSAKDGIPGPVWAVAQTPDGYLWIASQAGLYRFDGVRFLLWSPGTGEKLPFSTVRALRVARDGSLWMGFDSGAVSQLRDGQVTNYFPGSGLPKGGILSVVEAGDGTMWACGQYGLSRFKNGVWQAVGKEMGFPAQGGQTLLADRAGNLWVATDGFNFGLSADRVRSNTILRLPPQGERFVGTQLAVGMVWSFAESPSGEIWAAETSAGVAWRIPADGTPASPVKVTNNPLSLIFDNQEHLWIGANGDLVRLPNFQDTSAPLADHDVQGNFERGEVLYASVKDREGNLWFGTGLGLHRFRENKVTPMTIEDGLFVDRPLAVAPTQDGSVWVVGYTNNFVQQITGGKLVKRPLPAHSISDTTRIISIHGAQDRLWLNGSFGLASGVDGRFEYVAGLNLEEGSTVETIATQGAGDLWISVWGNDRTGHILRRQNGVWTDFTSDPTLPKYRCRVLETDRSGRVWLGFENGEIAVYDQGRFSAYSSKDGLSGGRILAVSEDRKKRIWVCSEGGLSYFDGQRFTTLTKDNGLSGNSVSAILEDDQANYWLACSLAILRVPASELDRALVTPGYRINGTPFDVMDGLPGLPRQREPFPTAARSADGRLWFATSQGLAVIDPQHLPRNRVLPPVKIEAVRAEGQSVAVTPEARLNPHTKNLEIEYTALSLTAPERVAFRYLLEGYDRDWRGPVTTRQASYTNLPPGHYRFRLIASNNDGVWNETGTAWDFFIEPALYQRRWFQVAVAIALGASFTGLYHLRLRRIQRHNAKLLQENTERRRAEADLRKTRAYMVESERLSLTGSFSWVLKTGELFWSCELYRIYELDASTVPTLRFVQSRVHPQDVDIVKRTTIEAVRGRKDFSLEYRLLMPDGSVKFLEVLAHATLDDHGGLVEYVGAVKDVTEQKKAEGAMHGMCAQIAHVTRVATLGELTASIAHEVNQPLGSIVTNASAGLRWLAGARPNLEEAREALQWIVADGNRAGDIVKRIRSLVSKAESEPVPTDLNELVRETIPLVQWELRQADVNLHWELDSRLPRVLGDRVQLQQVILNLVINGLEAMAGIESGPRDMTIRTRTFGDTVEVAVEDSGTGLDPATVTQIFNAFHTTKPSGMGMGLAICRSIIENHCGRLWAEPNAGPGATFRFALPIHAP